MFHFNFYNSNQTQICSTGVKKEAYEDLLVKICALPLKTNSRLLQMPEFIQEQVSAWKLLGEQFYTEEHRSSTSTAAPSLNEVCAKLSVDSFPASSENTFNDTFEAEQNVCIKSSCGEDWDYSHALVNSKWSEKSETESKSKPWDKSPSTESQVNLAKLLDMSVEEQRKKGLLGLQFKVVKIANEGTKRHRTKFVCTFEGCGKICENKWSFLDHNRHHTGDKPYECKVCNKKFTQRGNLKQHITIHKE